MKTITTIHDMQSTVRMEKQTGKSIGFVPTMGYLHEGHMSLLQKAREMNDIVVLSIFVNPLQFGPGEDLETYPRDLIHDEQAAENSGADYLFYPTIHEMYGDEPSVTAVVKKRVNCLCGRNRIGHFDGVATVLTKLFNIIQPDRAYFGLKDAQQVAVVDGLIHDFNFPIELVPVSTVREEDGLAKSSRNVYLLQDERVRARELYQALLKAEEAIDSGERDPEIILRTVSNHIISETGADIDYVEVLAYPELKPVKKLEGKIIIALAVKFQKARLIDNMIVTIKDREHQSAFEQTGKEA
ncbi:pantoate--beta-alanine ligase [Bacillus massiliglaciei]|uniref:pantoate--beta-alanine ligase n=1 Tax=Bacillus massiliglaciei TaxID=1816693 RepID=UPI000A5EC30C|nr:pantoate--beta-alanine ligase [Bacillus massiliglaciei]